MPEERDSSPEFEVWLECLKLAKKKVGSRVRSRRLMVRQQALREVAALAASTDIKRQALQNVLARKSKKTRE